MDLLFPFIPLTNYRNKVLFHICGKMPHYITQSLNQRRALMPICLGFCSLIINTDENNENDLIKLAGESKWGRKAATLDNKAKI